MYVKKGKKKQAADFEDVPSLVGVIENRNGCFWTIFSFGDSQSFTHSLTKNLNSKILLMHRIAIQHVRSYVEMYTTLQTFMSAV